MKAFIFIINEQKHTNHLIVDGISGKPYKFDWSKDEGYYIYHPKSQDEINDIMESQFHQIFYYSMKVPGMFDPPVVEAKEGPTDPSTESTPGTESKEDSSETVDPDPEVPDNDPDPEAEKPIDFMTVDEDLIVVELEKIEDKDALIAVIEQFAGTAPAKQSKPEKFRHAAFEAIIAKRKSETAPEDPEFIDM